MKSHPMIFLSLFLLVSPSTIGLACTNCNNATLTVYCSDCVNDPDEQKYWQGTVGQCYPTDPNGQTTVSNVGDELQNLSCIRPDSRWNPPPTCSDCQFNVMTPVQLGMIIYCNATGGQYTSEASPQTDKHVRCGSNEL